MDRRAWSLRQTGAKGERDVNLRMGTGTRWLAFLLLTGCAMLLWGQRYRESRPPESLEALMDSEGIGIAILSVRTAKDSGQTRVLNRTPWWHRESIDPSTRLPIASLSKPITASVVRRLVVQGRLHLDTAAISLLPELRTLPDPRASRITVRHLLQHTSGLDQSAGDPMFHAGAPIGCRGAIAASLARRLETPPGTRMRYSNTGYCLLGEIISRVTGESYEIATRRLLGEVASDGLEMGTAAGALPARDVLSGDLVRALGAAGGWSGDAATLATLYGQDALDPTIPMPTDAPRGNWFYGLGWRVWRQGNGYRLTHFGNLPGTFSAAMAYPDGSSAVVLMNGQPANPEKFAALVYPLLDQELVVTRRKTRISARRGP